VADALDVKTNKYKRAYVTDQKIPRSFPEAATLLAQEAGMAFDPRVIEQGLLPWIEHGYQYTTLAGLSFVERCSDILNINTASEQELKDFIIMLHNGIANMILAILDPSNGLNKRGCPAIESAYYAMCLGQSCRLSDDQLRALYYAATIGSVSDIYLPEEIEDPKEVFQKCVDITQQFWGEFEDYQSAIDIISYTFESYDGSAGLHGLRGENIPLLARILRVANIYAGLGLEAVVARRGGKLDPQLVDIFLNMLSVN
jgi:response regulator RpfG family c-di-GMP phosphodiesterase